VGRGRYALRSRHGHALQPPKALGKETLVTPAVPKPQVIPTAAWVVAGIVFFLVFIGMNVAFLGERHVPAPIHIFLPFFIAAFLCGYALLVGYVYGDAKRRGMRYVMWTWLAILVPNGIGIILYFILRDPLTVYCSRCGAGAQPGFAFCPRCGTGMAPACPQCHKVCQTGWSHCPYCGVAL